LKIVRSIARNKAEKSEHLKLLFSNLQGKAAIDYLNHQIKTKIMKSKRTDNLFVSIIRNHQLSTPSAS